MLGRSIDEFPVAHGVRDNHMMVAEGKVAAGSLRLKWRGFLLLGLVLTICGSLAIALPALSTAVASLGLGVALIVVGIVKTAQTFSVKGWAGSPWQTLGGIVEIVGGILICFNPLKGAIAISLLIALVFIGEGITQTGLALKVRPQQGWGWLLTSGMIAFAVSLVLLLKLPFIREFAAGSIAGISLVFAGLAYVAIAYASRKAQP
jgi:uncharacterized membrane protein HdeD (DUF308 family)